MMNTERAARMGRALSGCLQAAGAGSALLFLSFFSLGCVAQQHRDLFITCVGERKEAVSDVFDSGQHMKNEAVQ